MRLVDSHCHLQDKAFDADRDEAIARALAQVDWLVTVGDCLPSSRAALALSGDRILATAGIHPHHASDADDCAMEELRALASSPGVVAVGEIGLDYYYDHAPHEVQHVAFTRQLALAVELGMPVVIHNRDSHDDMAAILDEYHRDLPGGVMHCFSGDASFARRCADWGLFISFAGNVTFPKAHELREAAVVVPMERLLIETDAPYLAPVPLRGKRCEPGFVQYTCEALAALRGVPADELAEVCAANAARLFRKG